MATPIPRKFVGWCNPVKRNKCDWCCRYCV